MEITMKEKDAISESLRAYVAKYPSQTKAAGSLKGVSVGTVSNILNGRYENISDEMFRNVASQVGGVSATGWQIVETGAYQEITAVLSDAQRWRNVTWVTGEAGCGKSTTARVYLQEHREVFYILCSEDMKKGDFVREIARTVGIRTEGYNIREVWGLILDDIILPHTPQIKVTCRSLLYHLIDVFLVSHTVGGTDREHVVHVCRLQLIKFPSDTAVELLVAGLLVSQTIADAFGNIIGTQKHDAAFLLQFVVQADEVVEHRFGQLVRLVEHQQGRVRKSIHKVKRMVGE